MSEKIINNKEVSEHFKMSMEDYTERKIKEDRAQLISKAFSILKMAAQTPPEQPIPISF